MSASSGTGRSTTSSSGVTAEQQPEEVVDESFPVSTPHITGGGACCASFLSKLEFHTKNLFSQQLVIQNARDKILGDRLLQEKLAENINKILAK